MESGAIAVRDLGKRYRIGQRPRYPTLRDAIAHAAAAPFKGRRRSGSTPPRAEPHVWALRDVSFDVRPSEVLGIIGRNGAGKSTLLKILSRITDPTEGGAEIRGRVGSLLEVGTGFHPDLTGRENVLLNGAILGMRRADIARRFDAIVAFAEVERFIDTPVKYFSSGMYTRLAFAVAAHLEPEVLIVDEVLAVGDAAFQRKCLGRMQDVSHGGRTVLFVSHNMDAMRRLCTRCLLLEAGRLVAIGPTEDIVARYLADGASSEGPEQWIDLSDARRTGTQEAHFERVRYSSGASALAGHAYSEGPLDIEVAIQSDAPRTVESAAVTITSPGGTKLVNADIIALGETLQLARGRTHVRFTLEALHLAPGLYLASLWLAHGVGATFDYIETAFAFEIVPTPDPSLGVTPSANGLVPCRFRITQTAVPDATEGGGST
jgi:ABC-type polysaccharide/polyol phosphate transport system ATPase subunit